MEKLESIHDIAIKIVNEQLKNSSNENTPKETTLFILGSKGVVSYITFIKVFV